MLITLTIKINYNRGTFTTRPLEQRIPAPMGKTDAEVSCEAIRRILVRIIRYE